ncbi:MAG: zeta toxin family protein [Parcubacteria group bacterium]|jgi:thymidylate kinase
MKETKLIVLRGPSGSGKSSIAKAIQTEWLDHNNPMAYVEQDYFRRIVLKEKDVAGGFNIQMIKETVLFLLHNQYDVIMEGIFDKGRYEEMFKEIIRNHPSNNFFFYFDISFEETLRRHDTRLNNNEFGEKEMRSWYKSENFLESIRENIIGERHAFDDTVKHIRIVANL